MTSVPGEASGSDWFRDGLNGILSQYVRSRTAEHLDSGHPLWRHARQLQRELEISLVVRRHPEVNVRWSFGQGAWARIPWLALLDQRVARTCTEGVYVIYLFCEDMSGVYATLNQGITKEKERLGANAGRASIRRRSEELRGVAKGLDGTGFALSNDLDLHSVHSLAKDYQHGTVAHRFYETGKLPTTSRLLGDLQLLLEAYDAIVKFQLSQRA